MRFRDYYRSLDTEEKHAFAERAGTTHKYCYIHLQTPRKKASLDMTQRLVRATQGAVSLQEMVKHFNEVQR